MKKTFSIPEITELRLSPLEAVMSSMLREKGANGNISVKITDSDRDEAGRQSYWAGK